MYGGKFCIFSVRKMNVIWFAIIRQVERALSGINHLLNGYDIDPL
jgi:hypothetical protein